MRGAPPGRSGAWALALVLVLAHAVVDASNTTHHAMTDPIGAMPLSPNAMPNTTLLSPTSLNGTTSVATLCTGSSTKLPQVQCTAWINFYDGTAGDGWKATYSSTYSDPVCPGTRTDPCACKPGGNYPGSGTHPVCNSAGTTVVTMCVCPPQPAPRCCRILLPADPPLSSQFHVLL